MTRALTDTSLVEPYVAPPAHATTWTIRDEHGQLIRCVDCDAPLEVLLEDAPAYRRGHAFPRCAECSGDRRVLVVLHPPASLVAARRRAVLAKTSPIPHTTHGARS